MFLNNELALNTLGHVNLGDLSFKYAWKVIDLKQSIDLANEV